MHPPTAAEHRTGLAYGLAAYTAWGLLPLYFRALHGVPPLEILAHRIAWSVLLLAGLTTWLRRWPEVARPLRAWSGRRTLLATTLLISVNWGVYIWAVQAGRVLQASLGYFVNPLVSVLLGVVFLRERLRRLQRVAIAIAAAGVLWMVIYRGELPWLPLALALSFGLYGFVRKRAGIDPVGGLLAETALLAPVALAYLLLRGHAGAGAFGHDLRTSLLLAAAGPVTAIPLVWFALGVRSLPLSTVGVLQYVTPSLQFLLAVALYHEEFSHAHAVAFACIWAALALYTWDSLHAARSSPGAADTPPVEG
jgi:chloramphenicol-sensitive protein RarD